MSQRYRRDMYPYQQQSIPFTQAVPQSQYYHPAFEQMMAQTMQQTQERHDKVVSAIAEDRTARSMMPHVDAELHQQQLKAFTDDLEGIVKDYGGHYANAASRLISRMGKEESNPYYQFNREAVAQKQIAQQLKLQYGPSAMVINDPSSPGRFKEALESGDMSKLEANVIQRANYGEIIDKLGQRITPEQKQILLRKYNNNEGVRAFLESGVTTLLNEEMRVSLARDMVPLFKDLAPTVHYESMIQGGLDPNYAWTQDDEAIAQRMAQSWSYKDVNQTMMQWQQDPLGILDYKNRETQGAGQSTPTAFANVGGAQVQSSIDNIGKDFSMIRKLDSSIKNDEDPKLTWRDKELLSGSFLGVNWFGSEVDAMEKVHRTLTDPAKRLKFATAFGPILGNVLKAAIGRTDFTTTKEVEAKVVQAVQNHNKGFYEKYPIVKDLQEIGLGVEESLTLAQKHYTDISRIHLTNYSFRDSDIADNVKSMALANTGLSNAPLWDINKSSPEKRTTLRDHLNNSKVSVNGLSFVPTKGEVVLVTNNDGKTVDVKLPRDAFHEVGANILNSADTFFSSLLSNTGLTPTISSGQDLIDSVNNETLKVHQIGDKMLTFTKTYNPNTKSIDTNIFEIGRTVDNQIGVRQITGGDVSEMVLNYLYAIMTREYRTSKEMYKQ